MSQHPSLKSSSKLKGDRNVLKRYERIAKLVKELGEEVSIFPFRLPKYKRVRIKVSKKAEAQPKEEESTEAKKEEEKK
jgi:small basic protein (TIGR04137 family)